MRILVAAVCLVLAGCMTPQTSSGAPETITYDIGPCFGFCPVYRVVVSRSGDIVFTGGRYAAVTGERRLHDPSAAKAFFERLSKYRPNGERRLTDQSTCEQLSTDQSTVDVRWEGGRSPSHLAYYYGCDGEKYRAMAEDLRGAPLLLPIADLISKR